MPTDYELRRAENIARNKAMLEALDLTGGASAMFTNSTTNSAPAAKKSKKRQPRKRKTPPPSDSADSEGESGPTKAKVAKTSMESSPADGLRRSSRNAGKTIDYRKESEVEPVKLVARRVGASHDREPGRPTGKRIHDP